MSTVQSADDLQSGIAKSLDEEKNMGECSNQNDRDLRKQSAGQNSSRNFDNRILVIGPTPEKLYGNERETKAIEKYKRLTQELKSYAQKLYEDGYREFVTVSTPGYNKLMFEAVNQLKAEHPGEIRNLVLCPTKDCYKNYTDDGNQLFASKGVKKMIEESDKFIEVSEKLKGGMDEAVAISKHISVMYPEGGNSWHKRRDDVMARYMQIAHKYGNDLKQHEFFPEDTNAYKEYQKAIGRQARCDNMAVIDACESKAAENNNNMQYN